MKCGWNVLNIIQKSQILCLEKEFRLPAGLKVFVEVIHPFQDLWDGDANSLFRAGFQAGAAEGAEGGIDGDVLSCADGPRGAALGALPAESAEGRVDFRGDVGRSEVGTFGEATGEFKGEIGKAGHALQFLHNLASQLSDSLFVFFIGAPRGNGVLAAGVGVFPDKGCSCDNYET